MTDNNEIKEQSISQEQPKDATESKVVLGQKLNISNLRDDIEESILLAAKDAVVEANSHIPIKTSESQDNLNDDYDGQNNDNKRLSKIDQLFDEIAKTNRSNRISDKNDDVVEAQDEEMADGQMEAGEDGESSEYEDVEEEGEEEQEEMIDGDPEFNPTQEDGTEPKKNKTVKRIVRRRKKKKVAEAVDQGPPKEEKSVQFPEWT